MRLRRPVRHEEGYALLVVLLFMSVLAITLAAALPQVATEAKREREARMIDHAREYRTAIRRYYHKNGRYPASLDVLEQKDGNNLRYLREAWPDPLMLGPGGAAVETSGASTGGASSSSAGGGTNGWDLIHYGQAVQAEIVDQPPAAASSGGTTPGGGTVPGGGAGGTIAAPGAGVGAATLPGFTAGPLSAGGSQAGAAGGGGGGGPIIGVASLNKQPAVHAFNGFDTPDKWQFVYNFTQDPTLRAGGATALPGGGIGTPLGGGGGATTGPGH